MKSQTVASVGKQVDSFIAQFDPGIAKLARAVRTALRQQFPTAVELVYDGYNALAMGFCASEKASDCVVSVAVYPKSVALSFYYGATLPDPEKILSGSGSQNRFIHLDHVTKLREPAVVALIGAAIGQAKTPLPATERGYTVIKSIAAKRRPRRPKLPGA